MFEMTCNTTGIFSIGNMYPLNNIVGNIIPIKEINIADCCEEVTVEINNPKESAVIINNVLSKTRSKILPLIGRSSAYTLSKSMAVRLTSERNKYGIAFEMITIKGFIGDTNNISIVPISFSRTIETEVIITQTSNNTMAMTPGTKLGEPLRSGL